MTPAFFLDTTVFRNFASVSWLELLWRVLRGRGRWALAIAYEVEVAAGYVDGLDLASCRAALGDPCEIDDPGQVVQVEHLRRAIFGGRADRPLQHLGEAETLVLLQDPQWSGARWVSDDRHAVRYARGRGLLVSETSDLLEEAVSMADLAAPSADALLLDMVQQGRGRRLPTRLRS